MNETTRQAQASPPRTTPVGQALGGLLGVFAGALLTAMVWPASGAPTDASHEAAVHLTLGATLILFVWAGGGVARVWSRTRARALGVENSPPDEPPRRNPV